MNAPFEVADLNYSVTWPAAEPFVIPAQVAAALTAARTMLAETSARVEAEVMLGLPRNRGRLLLGSIVSTVEADLKRLASPTTRVVFIGQAGIGKSTSICLLTNLTRSDDDARAHRHRRLTPKLGAAKKAIAALEAKATEGDLDPADAAKLQKARAQYAQHMAAARTPIGPADADRILLPASAGRTTLCAMEMSYAPEPKIVIVPMDEKHVLQLVIDVAADTYARRHKEDAAQSADGPISGETARAIRNMAGLTEAAFKQLADHAASPHDLARSLVARLNLHGRTKTEFSPHPHEDPGEWLSATIAALNYCLDPEAPYAARIQIFWPGAPQSAEIIDTRGLDGFLTRELRAELEDEDAVIVLCSSFEGVPDMPIVTALRHAAQIVSRRSGMVLLALSKTSAIANTTNIDDDEDPDDRKVREAKVRLAQERLPVIPIVAGNVSIQAPAIVGAITAAMARIRRGWASDLARHTQVLVEATKTDHGAILDQLAVFQKAHVAAVVRAGLTPALPYDARLFAFAQPPHPGQLAASIRRRGLYENLNAADIAADTFMATIGTTAANLCELLTAELQVLHPRTPTPVQEAAFQITSDRIADFRRTVPMDIRDRLVDLVAEALASAPADDVIDICRRAYGAESHQVRGKEKYRDFVIRHLDHWMTDEQELGPVLGNEALAMWQDAVDQLVRHEDAYTDDLSLAT